MMVERYEEPLALVASSGGAGPAANPGYRFNLAGVGTTASNPEAVDEGAQVPMFQTKKDSLVVRPGCSKGSNRITDHS
jgi:hypothetical protein